ncbi:MAG: glycosyltransferase family 2 protein [Casimicrobiaceae bacterium]
MTAPPETPIRVDLQLVAPRGDGAVDVSTRAGADARLDVGGVLPFADGAVRTLRAGDGLATLSVRDRVQLLLECRRVLSPGGSLLLTEPGARETRAALARWAALVGLIPLSADAPSPGWHAQPRDPDPAPLVSIVIPSSNPRYFAECIDSAIAQTWRPIEIVVSDDSDADAIGALVHARAGRADIRYVKNPVRLKTRANYEQCVELARGEYIKFLNDDDVLEADCVATLVDAFVRVPGLTLATSTRRRIDGDSRPLPDMPATRPAVDRDLVVGGVSLANATIMHGLNFIGEPSTALIRKRDFALRPDIDDDHRFSFNGEEVRGAVDFAMWSRVLVQGNAAFFARRLSRFRSHGEQAQANAEVVQRSIVGIRALQRHWIELGLFRRWPPHLLQARDFEAAASSAGAPWRLTPVLSVPLPAIAPGEAVTAWRATKHHAFEPQ